VGPITAKARRPSVVSRCRGTTSCRRLADDVRDGRAAVDEIRRQTSTSDFTLVLSRKMHESDF